VTRRHICMSQTDMELHAASSVMDAANNSGAERIDQLGNILYVGGAAIFVMVMILAIYGVYGGSRQINARRWIIGGGLVFPAVTLSVLLVYSLAVSNDVMPGASSTDTLRIHVIGKQWWWEVRYEQPGSDEPIVLANEVRLPTNQAVELVLSTTDVIHSFWAPSLAGKMDMVPGRTTRMKLQTSEEGTFRAVCAEYCGGQHALMALFVITQDVTEFNEWLAQQKQPITAPTDPFLKLGHDAFFKGDCHTCHTIRGTAANASDGPDLTHIGSRKSLAAGTLNNHVGTMAGWIAGPQDVKPGNKMPDTPVFTGTELRALSAWLGSLQ
jgi:cytochrome c oxidase subunit 2